LSAVHDKADSRKSLPNGSSSTFASGRRFEARLLDLRDFPMPFFDQAVPPAMPGRPPYPNEVVQKWTAQIGASDGFVFITPEYNYGTSAVRVKEANGVFQNDRRHMETLRARGSMCH
jgi:hypothetical protein